MKHDAAVPVKVHQQADEERQEALGDFLTQEIRCGLGVTVTLAEFLDLSKEQAASIGIAQHYGFATDQSHGKPIIIVTKSTRLENGRPLPYAERVVYRYVYDWPDFKLLDTDVDSPESDPQTQFEDKWEAACNGKLAQSEAESAQKSN